MEHKWQLNPVMYWIMIHANINVLFQVVQGNPSCATQLEPVIKKKSTYIQRQYLFLP